MKKISILLLLAFVTSCASHKPPIETKIPEDQKQLSSDQRQLNYGYALLYQSFRDFQKLNLLMAIKLESNQVHDVVKDLTKTSKDIQDKFDNLKAKYPNLNFEDNGKPVVMVKKGKDQGHDRIESFLPIVGKTGKDFDRSLVLFLSFSLNELKYIAQAVTEMEKNEGLKNFDEDIHNQCIRLEDRALKLLNEKYFKQNYFKSQTESTKK